MGKEGFQARANLCREDSEGGTLEQGVQSWLGAG